MVGAIQIIGRGLSMAAMEPSKTAQICYFRTGLIVLVNNYNYMKNFICKNSFLHWANELTDDFLIRKSFIYCVKGNQMWSFRETRPWKRAYKCGPILWSSSGENYWFKSPVGFVEPFDDAENVEYDEELNDKEKSSSCFLTKSSERIFLSQMRLSPTFNS